jgi:hypothetical protein
MRLQSAAHSELPAGGNIFPFVTTPKSPRSPPAEADALLDWCEQAPNEKPMIALRAPAHGDEKLCGP